METVRDLLDPRTLWVEYGIDDDITVSFCMRCASAHTGTRPPDFPLVHSQPFTSDFPRANIYEMISPDLLHQVIKGTFKDNLVEWVCDFIILQHGEARGNVILDDIDRRFVLHH